MSDLTKQKVISCAHKLGQDYDPRVRDALSQAPEGSWREFSAFAGPRLESLTAWNKVVLLGDASHPLSGRQRLSPFIESLSKTAKLTCRAGAFGSGAAFALEDGWVLARAILHTGAQRRSLPQALAIFDEIRSPYYARM